MAAILPNPFALKSNKNHRYLNCVPSPYITQKGVLKFCEEECGPNFRTENSGTPGCVNIKWVVNGKYLVRAPDQTGQQLMITATADSPNEEVTDEDCTLFKTENVQTTKKTVACRLVHVQSNLYLRPCYTQGEDAILCAVNPNPDPSKVDVLTAVGPK